MQAIIMAGGKGTRLVEITGDMIPKPLIKVHGTVLLDYVIENAIRNGCDNIIVCTGHLGHKIRDYIEQKKYNATIQVSHENEPLGTAGALYLISDQLEDEFFIIYADVYSTIDLKKMYAFHKKRNAEVTIAVHQSDHPHDSTVVKIDKEGKYLKMIQKPGDKWVEHGNLTQTSLYLVNKNILDFIKPNTKQDFETDIFPEMLKEKKSMYGYYTEEYTKDLGTPERYNKHINEKG